VLVLTSSLLADGFEFHFQLRISRIRIITDHVTGLVTYETRGRPLGRYREKFGDIRVEFKRHPFRCRLSLATPIALPTASDFLAAASHRYTLRGLILAALAYLLRRLLMLDRFWI